jgi:2-dehydropantoate 2-reductase
VGAGAIGLLVAARLSLGGEQVTLLARPKAADQLRQQGVALAYKGEQQIARDITVITDPSEQRGQADLAILCVKGYDTEAALPALQALNPKLILTLQNGIGNEELLIKHFGGPRILSGAITTSVEVESSARIEVNKRGGIGLAPVAGQPLGQWKDMFKRGAFEIRTYSSYQGMKWSKALLNMLGNATAAILDIAVEEVYANTRLIDIERRAFLEALAVMDRRGLRPINLPRYPAALLAPIMRHAPTALLYPLLQKQVAGGRGGKPPSLLLDLRRGNPRSEGQFLYGAVAQSAEEVGVSAPVNRVLWETLNAIATGTLAWDEYRKQPEKLIVALS